MYLLSGIDIATSCSLIQQTSWLNSQISNGQGSRLTYLATKGATAKAISGTLGQNSPTYKLCNLSFLLVTFQLKTLLEEKTVIVELGEYQPGFTAR